MATNLLNQLFLKLQKEQPFIFTFEWFSLAEGYSLFLVC